MKGGAAEVFAQALRLGLTSFGGPIAHLGYFERRYVRELKWLSAEDYAGIVALCQALPGPASSQTGFLIGWRRAGWAGGLSAWLGFTLPSALLMLAFARLAPSMRSPAMALVLHGLKLAAVAVVALAVVSMAMRLCRGVARISIAVLALLAMLLWHGAAAQLGVLLGGALLGLAICADAEWNVPASRERMRPRTATIALALFLVPLAALPIAAVAAPHGWAAFVDAFYRAGALVFGGGHVVLPLLRDALVPGWVSDDAFLAGYGAAQALPGPLFAFSAYLGEVCAAPGGGLAGASIALVALFLPGLLIAVAGLRVLHALAALPRAAGALAGVNAAVVGILAAAWYDPVTATSVSDVGDAGVALLGFVLLARWRMPPILAVAGCVAAAVARGFAA